MFYPETIDRKKSAEILKNAMLKKYGSIMEYARQTGQEYKTVHSWTGGKRLPELEDIVATCNILEIPLEYVLVGTNREFESEKIIEDEYAERARCTYPNLIFVDVALLFPLIGMQGMMDIIYRVGDCNDSFYVYDLFRSFIQVESDAWKYCVYILQQRNSLLVDKIEKIDADLDEISRWCGEYDKKKSEFFDKYRLVENMIFQVLRTFG